MERAPATEEEVDVVAELSVKTQPFMVSETPRDIVGSLLTTRAVRIGTKDALGKEGARLWVSVREQVIVMDGFGNRVAPVGCNEVVRSDIVQRAQTSSEDVGFGPTTQVNKDAQ